LAKLYPSPFPGAEGRKQRGPERGIALGVVRTVVRTVVRAITGGRVRVDEHPRRHGPRHNRTAYGDATYSRFWPGIRFLLPTKIFIFFVQNPFVFF